MQAGIEVETTARPKPWWAWEAPAKKPSWRKRIAVIALVIAAIHLGVNTYYRGKDPVVNILDDNIQIKSVNYELDVYFYDITGISLVEGSLRDIGVRGTRAGAYGGFDGTLIGNFHFDNLGNVLLFVKSRSSPTIWIECFGKRDIYISFRDGKKTEALYNEMTAVIKK